MDGRTKEADTRLVRLGQAILDALGDRTQTWLANELGIDGSVVSRLVSGQITEVTVQRIYELETALKVSRGTLLRAAGYIEDKTTVLDAIVADKRISPEQKRTLRNIYEMSVSANNGKVRRS